MVRIKSNGGFTKTAKYFKSISGDELAKSEKDAFTEYGDEILRRLSEATPRDTGKTAESWTYTITEEENGVRLDFYNLNINDGACIAVLIQYGHGTPGGTYVPGIDYINPACKPYFDKIETVVWKEVAK